MTLTRPQGKDPPQRQSRSEEEQTERQVPEAATDANDARVGSYWFDKAAVPDVESPTNNRRIYTAGAVVARAVVAEEEEQ